MNVLVTGGAGFIGSNFIRYLIDRYRDISITNLDKLTYCGNLENLKGLEKCPRYKFVKGDICDEKIADSVMKDVDEVFHFAADSTVDTSLKDPFLFTKTNVIGTHVLLESARKYNIKKFV